MARSRICQSPWQNLLPTGKDKLTEANQGLASTNGNSTPTPTPIISYTPTSALIPPFAPAKLVTKYINTDLQKAIKLALELFVQSQ